MASKTSGSGVVVGVGGGKGLGAAGRRVRRERDGVVEVLTDRIVVPDGMPVPVMVSPATSAAMITDARDGRRSARQCAVEDEGLVRAGQGGHARVGVDVAQRHVEVGDGDVR